MGASAKERPAVASFSKVVEKFRADLRLRAYATRFHAHRLCVSLNSRLESNKAEKRRRATRDLSFLIVQARNLSPIYGARRSGPLHSAPLHGYLAYKKPPPRRTLQ